MTDGDRALDRVAKVGPFFAVRHDPGDPGAEGYTPLAEVHAHPEHALARRVAAVSATVGAPEPRVAASLVFQGLAARLWSVSLGAAVLTGLRLELDPGLLYWNPDQMAPDDLWLPRPRGGQLGRPAEALGHQVVDGHLEPLVRATRSTCRIAEGLLWGNAASALAGTLRVLDPWCARHDAGDVRRRAVGLVAELLDRPPLRGLGEWSDPGRDFRRHSCCLYYRVPGGGLCGDCALAPRR
ncbi:(2Fe-2S)-binding protein [Streptomyces sp. NPDC005438]|uniref:(2Fe-2S)-binding protein n=1 Tax=Streptomyces sp. NPDC005438 TaxID=3156880 RepID=UPI00339E7FD9